MSKRFVQVGEKIRAYIGILRDRTSRKGYIDSIPKIVIRKIGGRWWKKLRAEHKQTYLHLQRIIVEDNENVDHHIGDETFQNVVIGSSSRYSNVLGEVMSDDYLQGETFNFPHHLNEIIKLAKSPHNYGRLLQELAMYIGNVDEPDSRGRRYEPKLVTDVDGADCIKDTRQNPKIVPTHPEAKMHYFKFLDQIYSGIEYIRSLLPEEQEELLIIHIIPNVNSGYPYFTTQKKSKIKKMWRDFCRDFLGISIKEEVYLTVDEIFDAVREAKRRKANYPYVLFYRTQIKKDRCVFGAPLIQKFIAAVLSAAKEYAFNEKGDFLVDEHIEKFIYSVGGLPIVAQLNWTDMFHSIRKRFPQINDDGTVRKMSSHEIKELFDYDLPPGYYNVNVFGDDFPKFDTGMIHEDFDALREHRKLGWLMGYVLDDLMFSEVWTGDKRVLDVFFKSGHPFTSDFGSFFHRVVLYNTRDWIRRTKRRSCHILAACLLSDDSIVFTIGMGPEDVNEYLETFGLKIKVEESYDYAKHHIVGFLKVLVGYPVRGSGITAIGDPVSRYHGIAHSEREIEQDLSKLEDFKADVKGVWYVTGKIDVDAFISKLASFGNQASIIVMAILKIVKDTTLGKETILAISNIDPSASYTPYRSDVPVGFDPAWLGNVPVQELLLERDYQ
jgi:hypothetical protein